MDYAKISSSPITRSATIVCSRQVHGLAYRNELSIQGVFKTNLLFKPCSSTMNTPKQLNPIYGLTFVDQIKKRQRTDENLTTKANSYLGEKTTI